MQRRSRRARSTSGAARATSSGTRARPPETSSGSASSATTATPTPFWRSSTRPGPPATPGERTCFHRAIGGDPQPVAHEALPELERTLAARKAERPEGSYTAELLADPDLIGEKVREEADEVARAVAGESDERVAEEAADVLYHLEVALLSRDIPIERAFDVLIDRRR